MKTIKYIVLSLVILLSSYNEQLLGQIDQKNILKKNIISGNIMGTSSVLGISYQRIVGNKVAIELGVGLIGIGTGLTVYPKSIPELGWCFYTGIKLNSAVLVDVGGGTIAYIPFGGTLFSKNNIVFGFDIGPARAKWTSSSFGGSTSETSYYYCGFGNLKIGYRF